MKYSIIKNNTSSIEVSKVAFGIANFNDFAKEKDWFDLLDCYVSYGGNLIDTALVYGQWVDGHTSFSEITLGKWIKARDNRNKIIISTKGSHPPLNDRHIGRLAISDIEDDINQNLDNIGVNCIDIYFLHRDDESLPVEPIITTLNKYVSSGKIKILGASNWSAERINEANRFAKNNNMEGFSVSQISYSLARITPVESGDDTLICMNDSEYDSYIKNNIPIMAYASQARGFFIKNFDKLDSDIVSPYCNEENLIKLNKVRNLCKSKNLTPAAVSLAYLTSNKLNVYPIIGCSSKEQLINSIESVDTILSQTDIEYLDDIKKNY